MRERVTPWCDAKHYDHVRADGAPDESSTYCTCAESPGHVGPHRCFGCARTWSDET